MIFDAILFDPMLPWPVIGAIAALATGIIAISIWQGLTGWPLRLAAVLCMLAALSNPSWQSEDRTNLSNIVLAVIDESASQTIGDRASQSAAALAHLEAQIQRREDAELHVHRLSDGTDNAGTLMMQALRDEIAEIPAGRLAGVVAITDGQAHDLEMAPDPRVPFHLLRTGEAQEWDRRLEIVTAPAYAILGEAVTLTIRIEDQGAVPAGASLTADLQASVDGAPAISIPVEIGQDVTFSVNLNHAGTNIIHLSLREEPGELTSRNNAAVVQINGIRDRLQVLLVSGEPYAGGRTWRNLLKSDSAVDLVHFTILRPPEKFDNVPVDELSLIAFPTRELFVDKINEFDLIIFDRYRRRGLLPAQYFDNIRTYVEEGGAVLMTTGPEFAGANSMYFSSLGPILPVVPTAQVIEQPFLPTVSETGQRHPVTQNLGGPAETDAPGWGRWMRQIELNAQRGHTILTGANDRPLLVLDRVEDGRVAVLASDQAWLWSRGFEGGGPQLELLRRLAHWLMQEPELEEDALQVETDGQTMVVTRRSVDAEPQSIEVTGPDGAVATLDLMPAAPGAFTAEFSSDQQGLFRINEGNLSTVAALGPAAPKEFEETISTSAKLGDLVGRSGGADFTVAGGLPDVRWVSEGRPAKGRGWMGFWDRAAYETTAVRLNSLLPGWAWLLLAAGFSIFAWLREGRR